MSKTIQQGRTIHKPITMGTSLSGLGNGYEQVPCLGRMMSMPPQGALLPGDVEPVGEVVVWQDGALGDHAVRA